MSIVWNVVIAYLVINLSGTIYDVIRMRKEWISDLKSDIKNTVYQNMSWKFAYFWSVTGALLFGTFAWAPLNLNSCFKK